MVADLRLEDVKPDQPPRRVFGKRQAPPLPVPPGYKGVKLNGEAID